MKKQSDLQKLYRASYRCALDLANKTGVSKQGRKKFISDNTSFIYNDCKKNKSVREHVLSKFSK